MCDQYMTVLLRYVAYGFWVWAGTVHAGIELSVCTDFHCRHRQTVLISAAQWQTARTALNDASSASQERAAVAHAVARLEQIVGAQTGTITDLAENRGVGSVGQLDCIAESKNTTAYLRLLEQQGLLRWHRVEPRQKRAPWFFDSHWAAVLKENASDREWAVDSWFRKNGQTAVVQSLPSWRDGEPYE